MKIHSNIYTTPSFKAGLTPEILRQIEKTNVRQITQEFGSIGIKTHFRNDKFIAYCCKKTMEIFKQLNLPLPSQIKTSKEALFESFRIEGIGNCVKSKNGYGMTDIRSSIITFPKVGKNILSYDIMRNIVGYSGDNSTSHFLGAFIHEFLHCAHSKNIQKICASEQIRQKIFRELQEKELPDKLLDKIYDEIGMYGTKNLIEFYAEYMTQKIAQRLNPELRHMPDKVLAHTSKELEKLAQAVFTNNNKVIEDIAAKNRPNILQRIAKILFDFSDI